jgi:GNAT superfamily N-acetyltransferase
VAGLKSKVEVRAPYPGDGTRLAELWRVLWDVHESWGSYAGTRDPQVYADLALRLSEEARSRGLGPLAGRHVHLVAALEGEAVGQVEGWIDRHGMDPSTKWTCEVRSLVVAEDARNHGAARALIDGLARVARGATLDAPTVLAAEVLERNPAMAFYRKLGFWMPAYSVRTKTSEARDVNEHPSYSARLGVPEDALAVTFLEANLAERRRLARDDRFDRPRALDASLVDAIAIHLGHGSARGSLDPAELVVVDRRNVPRASATLTFAHLDPPFMPGTRAILSRFSFDSTTPPAHLLPSLVRLAGRLSRLAGAEMLEVVDLPAPPHPAYQSALALGAKPWSRVALRDV